MNVLCRQPSVQDLRVRPRLGQPGRQSCVSWGPRQGAWEPKETVQHQGQKRESTGGQTAGLGEKEDRPRASAVVQGLGIRLGTQV